MKFNRPLVVAHRGASAYVLDNTLEAFELALKQGATVLEMDIRQTKDGHIIVLHNLGFRKRLRRYLVKNLTLDRLQFLTNGKILVLEDVIKRFKKRAILDFDIKDRRLVPELIRLIKKHKLDLNRILIDSRRSSTLEDVRLHLPKSRLVLSYALSDSADLSKRKILKGLVIGISRSMNRILPIRFKRKVVKNHYYGVSLPYSFVYKRLVDYFHKNHVKVFAWPPDTEKVLRRMVKNGVDGIKTPRPDVLSQILKET